MKRRRHGEAQGIIPVSPREALQHALHCHSRQPPRHPQGAQRASPASSRLLGCPTQPDAPGRFQAQPTDDSPEPRITATCCGAIACSSWTGSRTAHFIPFMACMAFIAGCQRPRPRHPCLESLSETVTSSPSWPSLHWRISLVLKCWLNSLHAHMTFIAFNLQL